MTYVMDLHEAHIDRARRLNGKPVAPRRPQVRTLQLPPRVMSGPIVRKVSWSVPDPAPWDLCPMPDFVIPTTHVAVKDWLSIVKEVCTEHGFTLPEILGRRRYVPLVAARHEAFYRLATETCMSLSEIGRRMGDKDHTTVMWGMQKHMQRMAGK